MWFPYVLSRDFYQHLPFETYGFLRRLDEKEGVRRCFCLREFHKEPEKRGGVGRRDGKADSFLLGGASPQAIVKINKLLNKLSKYPKETSMLWV